MNKKQKPYCKVIEDKIMLVVFGNELSELNGYAIEGDENNPFYYVLGTDAQFEKRTINTNNFLVATNHKKDFFRLAIDENTTQLLNHAQSILVVSANHDFNMDYIYQVDNLSELQAWLNNKIARGVIEGTIYCFYAEEDKKAQLFIRLTHAPI